jgi:pimeloyl-ACP methyl ester carboxylesterase
MLRKIILIGSKVTASIILGVVFIIVSIYLYNTYLVETKERTPSAPATTKFVTLENEQIAYSEIDNHASTTVIFVGGLSAWNGTWARVVQEANKEKRGFNYIALDLPPFGYSLPDAQKLYFRDVQAERLKLFIEKKHLTKVILVGHSYGAGPVTEYVLNNQDKVQKLILISAVLNIDETKVIAKNAPVQIDLLRNILIGTLVHNDTFALSQLKKFVFVQDHMDQDLLDTYTRYFDTKETSLRLSTWLKDYTNDPLIYTSTDSKNYKTLNIPVRLIWGDKDVVTPISGSELLLKTIPNVKLTTLNNIGHIPMVEDYELFDSALINALNN